MMLLNYLRFLLLPFSLIYGIAITLRKKLYDSGVMPSVKFELPVICVGNLAVGGSGKTPTTEYLVRLLTTYKVAILSRGYGRKTKGFILADGDATAESIGDEPLQYYQKFDGVTVAVCEDRVKGIEKLKENHDLIILDDAFQHRRVKAGLNILLFEFRKLGTLQFLLPAGNLRDVFSSRKRADVLLVTKSPVPLLHVAQQASINELQPNQAQKVLHSYLKYGDLKHLYLPESRSLTSIKDYEIYLLTGIANPDPLIDELEKYTKTIKHEKFPDHYAFKTADIKKFKSAFESGNEKEKIIITTEKDSKRLNAAGFKDLLVNLPVYFLPIEVELFEEDKITFDELILNYVKSNRRNR
ncbi:tetraacyldisaccharide 4'-kinase [Pedobacter psychrotolerans]|uniref:Tetraacyldisaccharide 4'-kinase n=2 Tax=Pedobacter psychrotolerans TaxID=1843235 RepID=A0ABQ1SR65_9SPHI|nr:tetraacyldisaccharide 4'-kinase [Pedobacter psychrotolerans]GGE52990.1 tetraacyldisaccharide 4'-kinase [Pedobacter psychrotolerans]